MVLRTGFVGPGGSEKTREPVWPRATVGVPLMPSQSVTDGARFK